MLFPIPIIFSTLMPQPCVSRRIVTWFGRGVHAKGSTQGCKRWSLSLAGRSGGFGAQMPGRLPLGRPSTISADPCRSVHFEEICNDGLSLQHGRAGKVEEAPCATARLSLRAPVGSGNPVFTRTRRAAWASSTQKNQTYRQFTPCHPEVRRPMTSKGRSTP